MTPLLLSSLKPKDLAAVKEAFITYATPGFMKQFSLHLPYGYKKECEKKARDMRRYAVEPLNDWRDVESFIVLFQ